MKIDTLSSEILQDAQRNALNHCIQRASLPLIAENSGNSTAAPIYPRGTGLLFDVEDRLFLVTAGHVLDGINFADLSYPPKDGAQVQTFGNAKVFRPRSLHNIDVAVVELKASDTVEALRSNWITLTFRNVASKGTFEGGDRLIGGYPSAESQLSDRGIHQRPLVLSTVELDHTPSVSEPSPETDAFFLLKTKGYNLATGVEENIPKLQGVSGGGIWLCTDTLDQGIWNPIDHLKVVATQVSMASDQSWIRGAYWDAAAAIFKSSDIGLKNPDAASGI